MKRKTSLKTLCQQNKIPIRVITILLILNSLMGIIFYNTAFSYENKIKSMTDEEKLEYMLTLSEEEREEVYTHVKKDTAKDLAWLYVSYEMTEASKKDSFSIK